MSTTFLQYVLYRRVKNIDDEDQREMKKLLAHRL